MRGVRQKKRNMTLLFRNGSESSSFKGADILLLNRDKETVVDMMEDFDFDERLAII